MSWLASCILSLFHAVYYLINVVSSYRARQARPPNPLTVKRKQVPTHLALLLTTNENVPIEAFESELLDNVQQTVSWCRTAGIQRLTVYDREGKWRQTIQRLYVLKYSFIRKGTLYNSSFELRSRLYGVTDNEDVREVEAEIQYPLTPPASDSSSSSSRSLSPEYSVQPKLHVATISVFPKPKIRPTGEKSGVKRHAIRTCMARCYYLHLFNETSETESKPAKEQPFTLHIISRKSGKPAVAELASSFVHNQSLNDKPKLQVADIKSVLEGKRTGIRSYTDVQDFFICR